MPATATRDQAVNDLTGHPVIEEIARDLMGANPDMMATLTNSAGYPSYRLMSLAYDRFTERTGSGHGQLDTRVAQAVLDRLAELRAAAMRSLLDALPSAVTEARAAELEARQALRDMWRHGSRACPLTRYARTAGRLSDRLS
ncbi:hypothetical protein [Streptomyces sp. NPDC097619]|uniref:hypothetical protein n=1 Tax=Streptomyces sp. NPDC097619 TaxID=3157228 RepID=UPI0033320AFB